MELTVHGHNMQVSDDTRDYVGRKLDRVGRHISGIRAATAQLAHENTRRVDQRFSAQITLDVNGTVIRSEERASSAKAAIDAAARVIDGRVRRLKGRIYRSERGKQSGASIRFEQEEESEELEEEAGKVVRVKRFPLKPMAVEEALFEMEMLGHNFFLFLSTERQQYNLLYKRRDGDYGLIVPEEM